MWSSEKVPACVPLKRVAVTRTLKLADLSWARVTGKVVLSSTSRGGTGGREQRADGSRPVVGLELDVGEPGGLALQVTDVDRHRVERVASPDDRGEVVATDLDGADSIRRSCSSRRCRWPGWLAAVPSTALVTVAPRRVGGGGRARPSVGSRPPSQVVSTQRSLTAGLDGAVLATVISSRRTLRLSAVC